MYDEDFAKSPDVNPLIIHTNCRQVGALEDKLQLASRDQPQQQRTPPGKSPRGAQAGIDHHQTTEALTASSSGDIPETKTSSAAAATTSPRRVGSPRVAAESSPGGGDPVAGGGVVNPSLDMSSVLNDRTGVEKMVRSFNDGLASFFV